VRARKGRWTSFRKSTLKEFLQAASLADAIATAGDVRHIHAHFCHSATTVAWLAAIMTGIPLSFTAHAKDVYCEELNPAGLLIRKLAAARFVVTCTDANRTYLQGLTATPVHCLYHGLDVEFARLCGANVRPRQFDRRIRALAVGRLVAKKGLDVFIEACALLRDRGIALEATVVGESGDQDDALRALVAARGLRDAVTFTGPLTQAQLFDQYSRATVFCMLSRVLENGDRDGIPNVMAEAMACGVPVVATTVSGIPELLDHDVNGLLVAPDNAREAADAMESLHRDPGRADRLSRNGRTAIGHRFNGDVSAQALSLLLTTGAA
jgi:glycosyltransferase involved in cell wall biosynthesis